MIPYVVRQGDYLTALASRLGFDAEAVWAAAENADLRRRRASGEVLAPGDILFVPERRETSCSVAARASNRYRATVPTISIRLALSSAEGLLRSARFRVTGAGNAIEGTTDEQGVLSFRAPVTAREVQLELPDSGDVLPLRIGHLDPHDERSGVRQRLEHLGYLDGSEGDNADALRFAIEAFQRSHGIAATGVADETTCHAIRSLHQG